MDYSANIRGIFHLATAADIDAGREWYPTAGRLAAAIGDRTGHGADRIAAAMAALSPRNPWAWNVQDTAAVAEYAANGGDLPKVTTFGQNRDRAIAFLLGAADWSSAALKVRSFVANICGDVDAVTVDVWAIRVATGGACSTVKNAGVYRDVAAAYRTVAAELGFSPRDLQAITWIVAERIGLGSNRRGRHTATLKRGTFGWVADLLTAGGAA